MEDFSKHTDKVLLKLLKRGQVAAFETAYHRYWPLMHRLVTRMLGDKDLANDIVQDVFVSFWERRKVLDANLSLNHYLYAAARNQVLMHIRRSYIATRYLDTLRNIMNSSVPAADEPLLNSELVARFEAELQQLPPKMREAFELSRLDAHSYKEIATKMGISDNTVKHHISDALKILRKKLTALIFFFL